MDQRLTDIKLVQLFDRVCIICTHMHDMMSLEPDRMYAVDDSRYDIPETITHDWLEDSLGYTIWLYDRIFYNEDGSSRIDEGWNEGRLELISRTYDVSRESCEAFTRSVMNGQIKV